MTRKPSTKLLPLSDSYSSATQMELQLDWLNRYGRRVTDKAKNFFRLQFRYQSISSVTHSHFLSFPVFVITSSKCMHSMDLANPLPHYRPESRSSGMPGRNNPFAICVRNRCRPPQFASNGIRWRSQQQIWRRRQTIQRVSVGRRGFVCFWMCSACHVCEYEHKASIWHYKSEKINCQLI